MASYNEMFKNTTAAESSDANLRAEAALLRVVLSEMSDAQKGKIAKRLEQEMRHFNRQEFEQCWFHYESKLGMRAALERLA